LQSSTRILVYFRTLFYVPDSFQLSEPIAGFVRQITTYHLCHWVALRSKQIDGVHMDRLAYPLPDRIAGVGRTRIFEPVRKQELTKIEPVRERSK
jgi:hypothetical protein